MQRVLLFSLVVLEGAGILGLLYLIGIILKYRTSSAFETLISISAFAALACIVVGWVQIKSPASMVDIEAGRQQGLVKWFNPTKGFGFIEQDNGQDLFVHQSEIKLSGFRYLNKDDRVEYDIGLGKKVLSHKMSCASKKQKTSGSMFRKKSRFPGLPDSFPKIIIYTNE